MGKSIVSVLISYIVNLVIYSLAIPCLILLGPVYIIFDFFTVYHPNFFGTPNSPANHAKKVLKIQEQVTMCTNYKLIVKIPSNSAN